MATCWKPATWRRNSVSLQGYSSCGCPCGTDGGRFSAHSNKGNPDTSGVAFLFGESSSSHALSGLPGLFRPGWDTAFPPGFRRCLDFGMGRLVVRRLQPIRRLVRCRPLLARPRRIGQGHVPADCQDQRLAPTRFDGRQQSALPNLRTHRQGGRSAPTEPPEPKARTARVP